jgi:TolB-like protein/lipoprotein NlpI
MRFFSELRRRNVIRVVTVYVAATWLILQVANTVLPAFGFSAAAFRVVTLVLLIGLVPAAIIAWAFELTPQGLKREQQVAGEGYVTTPAARRLDRIIMVVLALGIGYFAIDRFLLQSARNAALVEATAQQARSDALTEAYAEKSIAVLPFRGAETLPSDDAILIRAFVDELRNLLISVRGLRVAADISSDLVAERQLNVADVGRLLNVSHVLSGTVRDLEGQIEIDVELVGTIDEKPVWSSNYTRSLDTLHGTSRSIVAGALPSIGIPSEQVGRLVPVEPDVGSDAYKAFLGGSHFIKQHNADGYAKAAELLEEAVALEPTYALAWAQLARAYLGVASESATVTTEATWRRARMAAERALALQPDMAEVWTVLAAGKVTVEQDFAGGDAAVKRALQINPNLEYANRIAGVAAAVFGRTDEAFQLSLRAVEVDPLSVKALMNASLYALFLGDFDRALELSNQALEIDPTMIAVRYIMARAHAGRGDFDIALESLTEEPVEVLRLHGRAMILAESGDPSATEALQSVIDKYSEYYALNIAEVYGALGDEDQAFAWLQKAIEVEDTGLMEARVLPGLTALHDDPRWEPFLESAGLSDPPQ